jgi:predicted aspartyl protease
MNPRKIIHTVILLLVLVQLAEAATDHSKLRKLYIGRQYFDLRDALSNYSGDRSKEILFFKGAIANKFNQAGLSIAYLSQYAIWAKANHSTLLLTDCYEMLADDYQKTYQYSKAALAYKMLLSSLRPTLNTKQIADYENSLNKSVALSAISPQTVSFGGDSRIESVKDKIGLSNFPVEINHRKISLPFDTGATLSVITVSKAEELKLRIINGTVNVESFTGEKVKVRLGIASQMRIGSVSIHNVVFLVFDDKDLYLSPISFQINGLIGFPVITALKEITFARNGEVFIPARAHTHYQQNMCFDGFTPLIAGTFKGKRLTFSLDTGATKSDFFPPFYKAYEDEIKSNYIPQNEKIRGAGGYKEVIAYHIKNLEMTFSGKEAHFSDVKVLTEPILDNSRYFYGNLGRDLISQFERMTINFELMSIIFD